MSEIYDDVYEKFRTAMWLLRKKRMAMVSEGGPYSDSTRGQGRIIALLKMRDGIPTSELSYLLGIRQQTLNEQIKKLEEGGLVERHPSEEDKRVMVVHLTEKGRETEQPGPEHEEILSCLSDEELKQFDEYLGRIIEALKKNLGDDADIPGCPGPGPGPMGFPGGKGMGMGPFGMIRMRMAMRRAMMAYKGV